MRIIDFFAIVSSSLVRERSAHESEQLACFFIGLCGGGDSDVHTAQLLDLIVIDLGEDDLFLQAHAVVAAAVECVCGNTAEVTNTGKSNVKQSVEELPHAILTQSDLNTDMHALTELEVSDGLSCDGSNSVLAGDRRDLLDNVIKCLCIILAVAAADGYNDLVDLGDLHNGLVLELLHQSRSNFLNVLFLHSCHSKLSPFSDFCAALLLLADANFLAVYKLIANASTLATLGADELDLADIHGGLDLHDAAVLALLLCLLMLGGYADALNDDLAVFGVCGNDLAGLALVLAGQDYDFMHMNTIMHDVEKYTHGERLKHTKRGKDEQYERFDRELKIDDFIREYTPENVDKVAVSDQQLEAGFKALRKETETERHFDCHACGFRSCADMAKAIVRGLNLPENCNQYMLKKIRSEQERIAGINEEVHQMMEKLRSVTEELDREMSEVKESATGIGKVGQENSNEMQNVITYMEGLEKLNATILTGMQDINVNAGKYREMSENVEQIAKDINLLSLNASIEAARAGEAGKGFAVVAENIRRLSDESKQSVAESQNNDKQIALVIKNVNQTVEGFSENIKNLTDVVNTAIEGVNQSSVKSEDIQTITGEMEEILQHIMGMVERTNEILTEGERL